MADFPSSPKARTSTPGSSSGGASAGSDTSAVRDVDVTRSNQSRADTDGYRRNVGIIVCNHRAQVLWARRVRRDGWQFPQGGMEASETAEEAAFRELHEEVGLRPEHVRLVGRTQDWLHYNLPDRLRRNSPTNFFLGQKQIWFLFNLVKHDSNVSLTRTQQPEFDAWRWVDYWQPLEEIVEFKRDVYRSALTELEPVFRGIVRLKFR